MGSNLLNSRKESVSHQYGRLCIFFILLSSIIQSYWGFVRNATPFWKAIIAVLCWLSIYYAFLLSKRIRLLPQYVKTAYVIMLFIMIVGFFRSLLFTHVLAGNRFVVLFSNVYAALNVATIVFLLSVHDFSHLKYLYKGTLALIVCSVIFLPFNYGKITHSYSLSFILTYIIIFFPYVSVRNKFYILFGIAISFLAFLGGGRQVGLTLIFVSLAYFSSQFLSKKKIFILSLLLIVTPLMFIYFYDSIGSIFRLLSNEFSQDENMSSDTRTFLYLEFFEDFRGKTLWDMLFGQGSIAYYYSFYFDAGEGFIENRRRFGIEIPILQWIMQCGVVFVICFTYIVYQSVNKLYRCGNNSICKMAMILISGYYFSCYVSNFNGCNISHLGFWLLVSISFNDMLLQMPDSKINLLLNKW